MMREKYKLMLSRVAANLLVRTPPRRLSSAYFHLGFVSVAWWRVRKRHQRKIISGSFSYGRRKKYQSLLLLRAFKQEFRRSDGGCMTRRTYLPFLCA
eukprot:2770417-Rhodomonas_salina.2